MAKIAYIGAGSTGFGKQFIADIMSRPALAGSTLALIDINQENLDVMTAVARKMARQLDFPITIEPSVDRCEGLDGAGYVLFTVEAPGGIDQRQVERRISEKYGVDQAVGCTTGLGGVFRAMRYTPLMLDICRDMERLCPDAWLLHYANPTSSVPWILNAGAPKIQSVGMCHSVQHTAQTLCKYIGVPYEESGHWVAGVNHQAWFLRFEHKGQDAYPLLWEAMQKPEVYGQDVVRFELMKYFGHFVTESSYHNSEYVPYFRKNAELIERFTPKVGRWVDLQESTKVHMAERREQLRQQAGGDEPIQVDRSHEYSIGIIEAMETNVPFRFNGNVMNTGLITNLPYSCVEVPCLVDNMGIHPCYVGDLPPQCASLNRSRSAGDELVVKAALEGDRKAAEQAVALDPLTAAVCTLDQIHDMVEETFAGSMDYLPQLK